MPKSGGGPGGGNWAHDAAAKPTVKKSPEADTRREKQSRGVRFIIEFLPAVNTAIRGGTIARGR